MKRREFIAGVVGAAAWPLTAHSQQAERMRRVGILMPYPPTNSEMQARVRVFREELRKRGWAAGVNAQFDERWTSDQMDLIRSAATNLIELNPDVILATGARVIPILIELTRSVPIVVASGADPVARGYAESLARPGRNVTGFATMELSIISKMLQTLKELAPDITHVSMIYNPDNPTAEFFGRTFESAARALAIDPTIAHVHGLPDIEAAVAATALSPNGGIFVPTDITINALMEKTVIAIAQKRLPAIYGERIFVINGGLASYGTDRMEQYRGCAAYADRILHGEKAGDLPYQQPTKYDLTINLKTAKALDLTIPPKLLFTADEVIE
jgi:putative ABC transport system substrate-binding protein